MEKLIYQSGEVQNPIPKILELTETERVSGIEYSHFMLKPEAIAVLDMNPKVRDDVLLKLFQAFSALELEVVWTARAETPVSVFQRIYQKEIAAGIIPDWEVNRFSANETFHIVVKGKDAIKKAYRIKGRFCYDDIAQSLCRNQEESIDLELIFQDETKKPVGWGSGCGIRAYLARKGIVFPDEGIDNYTVYNWIHTPDPGQDYAVSVVIEAINSKLIK